MDSVDQEVLTKTTDKNLRSSLYSLNFLLDYLHKLSTRLGNIYNIYILSCASSRDVRFHPISIENEIFNFQNPACASMILPCDARSNAAHGTLAAEENHGSARASELE